MHHRTDYLYLPYLDEEFQNIYGIKNNYPLNLLLEEQYRALKIALLLCDDGVIFIPAFLAESNLTKNLFIKFPDILESRYIVFLLKESNKKEYIDSKVDYYKESSIYKGYSDKEFQSIFLNAKFRILKKTSSKNYIKKNFSKELTKYKDKPILKIINGIENKPLTWENIFNEKAKKNFVLSTEDYQLRQTLNKLYNESITTNYNASILKVNQLENDHFNNSNVYIYDAHLFTTVLRMMDIELEFNLASIIQIENFKDSIVFRQFIEKYFSFFRQSLIKKDIITYTFNELSKYKLELKEEIRKHINNNSHSDLNQGNIMNAQVYGTEAIVEEIEKNIIIVFTDIVAFSQESTSRQLSMFKNLRTIINQELSSSSIQKSYCVSTGDGIAIFIENSGNISNLLNVCENFLNKIQLDFGIKVRTGIHCGQVNIIKFDNNTFNAIGHNVNMAARVMDIGDAGHVLLSKTFYDTYINKNDYHNLCSPLGNATIKHGETIEIYNFVSKNNIGNSNRPNKLKP